MNIIVVSATAVIAVGWVAAYFWQSDRREAREERTRPEDVQEVSVVVNGGYHPERVALRRGRPIRLHVKRTHDGESWWDDLDFPYARVLRELPEGETVTVDIGPLEPGEYAFFSGMGKMRGTLVIEGEGEGAA